MRRVGKSSVSVAIFCIILLLIFSLGYLKLLEATVPHYGVSFFPQWSDNTFNIRYQDPYFADDSFEEGWTISWTLGQSNNSSGFYFSNKTLTMYATFVGYNKDHFRGVSGIMLQKNVDNLNTAMFPYLIIRHIESSSSSALMFSFGVTDSSGTWHDGGWYHTSSSWTYLEFDLRKLYNGNIISVSIRLTNDFDPNYAGGIQHASVQLLNLYQTQAPWYLVQNEPVISNLTSEKGILEVSTYGNVTEGTIVSAQTKDDLALNLTYWNVLEVSIMTSSINVAARIVIWPSPSHAVLVLVKTYNDNQWHTEVVDLNFFGLTGHVYRIELGLLELSSSTARSAVSYKQLSISSLVVS